MPTTYFPILLIMMLSVNYIHSQNYPYDTTCDCISVSSNGNVCLQYTCTTKRRQPACFPGRSLVTTESGLMKSLSNVRKGENVLVMNEKNQLIYEPIQGFIHSKRDGMYNFLLISIEIDEGHKNTTTSLFISSNHLIFLANDTELRSSIFAGQLHVGDHIRYLYNNEIRPAKIQNIYLTMEEGFYAPLTPSGTIIIDNVLVSNYASVSNHRLAHYVMEYYRRWIFFFGSNDNSEDIPWILRLLESITNWFGVKNFGKTSFYDGVYHVSSLI